MTAIIFKNIINSHLCPSYVVSGKSCLKYRFENRKKKKNLSDLQVLDTIDSVKIVKIQMSTDWHPVSLSGKVLAL